MAKRTQARATTPRPSGLAELRRAYLYHPVLLHHLRAVITASRRRCSLLKSTPKKRIARPRPARIERGHRASAEIKALSRWLKTGRDVF